MPTIPEEIIIRALQRTANAEEIKILNHWLNEDKKNTEYYFQLEEIWYSNKQLSSEAIYESWKKFAGKIENLPAEKQVTITLPPKKNIPVWVRYVAAIFVGILIASAVWLNFPAERQITHTDVLVQHVVYNQSGVRPILLPDSSEVWINENTKLTYPEKFNNKERSVSLEGKAFFDIRKEPEKPFIVRIGNLDVEVTGTEFFIETVIEKGSIVTLISGSVNVKYDNKKKERVSTPLVPGQQAIVDQENGDIKIATIDPSYYVAWKDGVYRFNDEPLEKITELLAKRFDLDIRIASSLKTKRFTGKVSSDESIQEILTKISKSLPVKYHISGKTVNISEF